MPDAQSVKSFSLNERLDRRIDRSGGPDACWPWTGSKTLAGYGQIIVTGGKRGFKKYIHRLIYERNVGPIPNGYEVHHKCVNPPCCNPKHLEAVTHQQNMLATPNNAAARNASKDKCPKCGGPYTRKDGRGTRICGPCWAKNHKEWKKRVGRTPGGRLPKIKEGD